jgi:anthranilate/para-aminobenzoate synthase component I
VTGSFEEFVSRVDRSDTAGWFECAASPGGAAGWAVEYSDPEDVVSVGPGSNLTDVEQRLEEFFRKAPDGAAIGYLGFDAVRLFEPLLGRVPPGAPFPLGEIALVRKTRTRRAQRRSPLRAAPPAVVGPPRASSLPGRKYCRGVQYLRSAIRAGEAYQVVLANRRTWNRPDDLWGRALRLREAERFAFFYALKFGNRVVIGASPESVLEVSGRSAFVSPIAGTRPIGGRANARLKLSVDPKELAEHRMLVDLARNDLGRVAEPGGVQLLWQERPTRFARLEHLVSRVSCSLRRDVRPLEALGAAFPAGTVSGAPKIRATELLRSVERTWRGPYGGTVGVLRASGDATWALTIRSVFGTRDRLFTAAGAGIVYRSSPRREFAETLTKLAQVERVMVGATP